MNTTKRTGFWLPAILAAFASLFASQARAQSFPNKSVHIIVGVAPGGGVDTAARVLAQQLSKLWGEPVIVENRLGAAGAAAYEYVAKSTPDGYTLLVASNDITSLSALRSDLPYNLLHDLLPVSLISATPDVLVVNPSLPVHNVKELIALAKSEPGKITYGSAGIGSLVHLQTALLTSMANISMIHVPYKGSMQGVIGVADGEIDMDFAAPSSMQGLAKAGKLRPIAISSAQTWPLYPSVPAINESGLPGFSFMTWFGLFAPAGLPQDVLATLNGAVAKADGVPAMKAALAKQGEETETNTPAQFSKLVAGDYAESVKLVKLAGVKVQ